MKKKISIILAMILIFSLSVPVFAAEDSDVTVTGKIGIQDDPTIDPGGDPLDPDGNYDITFASSVYWYVTQTSYPNVVNGTSSGPDATHTNLIINNSAADIAIDFNSFTLGGADATAVEPNLELYLTGDLNADDIEDEDISNGWATAFTYSNALEANSIWEYGFSGEYTLPSGVTSLNGINYSPTYTMNLGFSF